MGFLGVGGKKFMLKKFMCLFQKSFRYLLRFYSLYFFVAFSWFFRGPLLSRKTVFGPFSLLFRGFFVAFSWPCFGQILRVLALEQSSDFLPSLINPHLRHSDQSTPKEALSSVGLEAHNTGKQRRCPFQSTYRTAVPFSYAYKTPHLKRSRKLSLPKHFKGI